ncbi:hypothetical protein HYALB_00010217 [Hymenoscyphus albidus]|uniref:Uncharacterized protein n=1 Tax=Hymenoscyphus albidus TaxID=595503 RepID=A0A9N9LSB9_9HELO|nr:hypothetical protein HYALB_00010217 [Hymenoscyphus albidus]
MIFFHAKNQLDTCCLTGTEEDWTCSLSSDRFVALPMIDPVLINRAAPLQHPADDGKRYIGLWNTETTTAKPRMPVPV